MSKYTLAEHMNKKFNLLGLKTKLGKKCVYVVHEPMSRDAVMALRTQYMDGAALTTLFTSRGIEHCFRHRSGGVTTIITMEQVRQGRLLDLKAEVTLFDKAVSKLDLGAHLERRKAH